MFARFSGEDGLSVPQYPPNLIYVKVLAQSTRAGDEDQDDFGVTVITNMGELTDKPISYRLVFLSAVYRKLVPGLPLSHHG